MNLIQMYIIQNHIQASTTAPNSEPIISLGSLKTRSGADPNCTCPVLHYIAAAVAAERHRYIAAVASPHRTVAADIVAVLHSSVHHYHRLHIQPPNCLHRSRCRRPRSSRRCRRGDLGSTWFLGACLRVRYNMERMERVFTLRNGGL